MFRQAVLRHRVIQKQGWSASRLCTGQQVSGKSLHGEAATLCHTCTQLT